MGMNVAYDQKDYGLSVNTFWTNAIGDKFAYSGLDIVGRASECRLLGCSQIQPVRCTAGWFPCQSLRSSRTEEEVRSCCWHAVQAQQDANRQGQVHVRRKAEQREDKYGEIYDDQPRTQDGTGGQI